MNEMANKFTTLFALIIYVVYVCCSKFQKAFVSSIMSKMFAPLFVVVYIFYKSVKEIQI